MHYGAGYSTDGVLTVDPAGFILREMNDHDGTYIEDMLGWIDDVLVGFTVLPGSDWDHKPEIIDRWGTRNRINVGGEVWEVEHDVWSNIHFGYVIEERRGFLPNEGWIWGATNLSFAGDDNPLDVEYIRLGIEIAKRVDGDVDRQTFDEFLARELPRWALSGDRSAPVCLSCE